MHFHVSDLKSFSNCRLQWSYASHMRMGRASDTVGRALFTGTFCHKALEYWYLIPGADIMDCYERATMELGECPDAEMILENYALWAEKYDTFEVLSTEQDFVVPLYGEHEFAGRWDLLVLKDGKLWLNDFKFTGMPFQGYAQYLQEQDEQARAYCWAGRKIYGEEFGGIMFTLVRSKPPELPTVLKNGGLSRNKSQKTTWELYERAIRGYDLRVIDYEDMLLSLNADPYIMRIEIALNERTLKAFERRAIDTAKLMIDPDVLIYPNANPITCKMCAFRFPCSVQHSIGPKAAHRILMEDYVESRYAREALEEDKDDVAS